MLSAAGPGPPGRGYLLFPRYTQGTHRNENFPGSVQTQVTGLNNQGVTVGFWSSMNNASQVNDNFGFYSLDGRHFHTVSFPTTHNATPPVNQLLGVNDQRHRGRVLYRRRRAPTTATRYNIHRHTFSREVNRYPATPSPA